MGIHSSLRRAALQCSGSFTWAAFAALLSVAPVRAESFLAESAPFRISIKHDGIRESDGSELLTWSSRWDGGEDATVTLTQDGEVLAENISGSGEIAWNVSHNGRYVLQHVTYENGVATKYESATFIVKGKDVEFSADDVSVSGYSGKYDGSAHGVAVSSAIDGLSIRYATSPESKFSTTAPTLTNAGELTVWCEIAAEGYITQTNSATVKITPRNITLTSAGASKSYDGIPLTKHEVAVTGDGFATGEGADFNYSGSQTVAGESENFFTYSLRQGTLAKNYSITTANGLLKVTKGVLRTDEEPGEGEIPTGGMSKFDMNFVYDGEGHTIDTNALTEAFSAAMGGTVSIMYGDGTEWSATAPAFTNVCEEVVWYRVTNPNYEDFAHAAKTTVTKRPVKLSSGDGTWVYDGRAHSNTTMRAEGFVKEEGIVAYDFAQITEVGTAENAFSYKAAEGTLADNYSFACETGTISVVAANMDGWADAAKWSVAISGDGAKYDGTEKTCEVTSVSYDGFAVTSFTVDGNSATDAGDYVLTIRGNGNFAGSHTVPWSIVRRNITLTSASASKSYDGLPLTKHEVAVTGNGFASGEGADFNYSGSQTVAGESENFFTYSLRQGTLAKNYSITTANGLLKVTKAQLDPQSVFGALPLDGRFVIERVFNGAQQAFALDVNFAEEYQILYALSDADESAYVDTPPTLRDVSQGDLPVFFKFTSANYTPYFGKALFRILPKTLTDEMVQLTDDAFFYDGEQKVPDVTMIDTNELGIVISTKDDWQVEYGDSTSAGAIPVIVTAHNNYSGSVTKTFAVLKRPVPTPVLGSKSYNGRTQKATIATDERWTVVENKGGVKTGEYPVTLRLKNPDDYMWKGSDGSNAEWTGLFAITRANNGWSRYPGIVPESWLADEEPGVVAGQARYGTLCVAYRRQGADISAEVATMPSTPGKYIARFWVDATEDYIGVALTVHYEVQFEILGTGDDEKDHTETTPVPVPYSWLESYVDKFGAGDYELAGNAKGRNGYALWESYVAGLNPEDPDSLLLANIEIGADGAVKVTWAPDLSDDPDKPRAYTLLGKTKLADETWTPVTDSNKAQMRFFKVTVEMK